MRTTQPKRYINNIRLTDKQYGKERRMSYVNTIMKGEPTFPEPVEYDDIDNEVKRFVEEMLDMEIDGQKVPTFTFYSNQRFSEYLQSWKHTDEDGNLYLNFKTINRELNPKNGTNQSGLFNIPGERKYTLSVKTVLDNNGKEYYEINTMKQPYCVDLIYTVNFVTSNMEYINVFNENVNRLFKAKQAYIRPNGHFMPILLEDISDDTDYNIDDRRFYSQPITLKVLAYIISRDSFETEKKPKNVTLTLAGNKKKYIPDITIDEYENEKNTNLDMTINFEEWHDKCVFDMEGDIFIEKVEQYNIRSFRILVNDTLIYTAKTFKFNDGDKITIRIKQFDSSKKSTLIFKGIDPNNTYRTDNPEDTSKLGLNYKSISIE